MFHSTRASLTRVRATQFGLFQQPAKRTRLVPRAKRLAYLPRTPWEKSYSARISLVRGARLAGLLAFFICNPFPTAGESSANDANRIAALDVGDDYKMLPRRLADQEEPVFVVRVVGIRNSDRKRITHDMPAQSELHRNPYAAAKSRPIRVTCNAETKYTT